MGAKRANCFPQKLRIYTQSPILHLINGRVDANVLLVIFRIIRRLDKFRPNRYQEMMKVSASGELLLKYRVFLRV